MISRSCAAPTALVFYFAAFPALRRWADFCRA